MKRRLPAVQDLTRAQFDGWACVWCSTPLRSGAVSAGRAEGHLGKHDLSIEVYECPACHQPPADRSAPGGRRDGDRSRLEATERSQ